MNNGIGTLTLLAIAASLSLTSCSRVSAKTDDDSTAAIPVRVARAIVEDVPLEITAVGNVEAINSVDVKSQIAGSVARVAFTEGQNVAKGQLLFSMDREALDRQAAEQRAVIDRDAAMTEQARAVLARDSASEKQSRSEADVAMKLGKLGVLSGQRVDQLTTARSTAAAVLASDTASLQAAESTLKADRAHLAVLQLQQQFTSIVAPISVRAGALQVKAGSMIRDNETTLVTLLQLAPIYVTFGIPEQSLSEVQRLNAQSALSVEASRADGTSRQGHLAFIDNTIDTATGTIRMKAAFPNADHGLWPGQFVPVRIRLRVDAARTVIPDSSIQDGLEGKYAWVIRSGRAMMTPLLVQRVYSPQQGPALAMVSQGIRAGDTVVTEGQLRLTGGARVSILNTPGDGPVS